MTIDVYWLEAEPAVSVYWLEAEPHAVVAPPPPSPTSYSVGAIGGGVSERDPADVRRLMRKKHDEAEILLMIRSLFESGAFDNEVTIQ